MKCFHSRAEEGRSAAARRTADSRATCDVLERINGTFRDAYSAMREVERSRLGTRVPVLVRLEDDLWLRDGGQTVGFRINGPEYHAIKVLCHLPVTAQLSLSTSSERASELVAEAGHLVTLAPWPASVQPAAEQLAKAVQSFVARPGDLCALIESQRPQMAILFEAAARLEIESLEKASREAAKLASDRFDDVHVVVCAGPLPRYKNVAKLFFTQLLARRGKDASSRIIYGECCSSPEDALDLLASKLAARRLGQALSGDPSALEEDVLGDVALRILESR